MKRGPRLLSQSRAHKSGAFHQRPVCCLLYLPQFARHVGMIPSFSLVLIGAAIAKQVQATATTRTKVLTARFIHFLLTLRVPWERKPLVARIIYLLSSLYFFGIRNGRRNSGVKRQQFGFRLPGSWRKRGLPCARTSESGIPNFHAAEHPKEPRPIAAG